MDRRAFLIPLIAVLIGLGISVYSFAHNRAFVSGEFCTLSETFNCDIVNRGPFSQVGGVSIALVGVIGYAFLLIGTLLKWRKPADRSLTIFLLIASLGGFLFSVYLTNIEAFVLKTWCLLCLTSQAVITITLGCAVWLWRQERTAKDLQS